MRKTKANCDKHIASRPASCRRGHHLRSHTQRFCWRNYLALPSLIFGLSYIWKRGKAPHPHTFSFTKKTQARKRHINLNFFCPVGLGTTPGLSRGFHRVCPWEKSGENLGHTRVSSLFYTVEARFHQACPWDKPGLSQGQSRGRRAAQSLCEKSLCALFAR